MEGEENDYVKIHDAKDREEGANHVLHSTAMCLRRTFTYNWDKRRIEFKEGRDQAEMLMDRLPDLVAD